MIYIARPTMLGPRVHKRRVEGPNAARWVALGQEARTRGQWSYVADHGGGVANAYNYRATTETVVAVASPVGDVVLWYGTAPANKVTLVGAARSALGDVHGGGALWDGRTGPVTRDLARRILRAKHVQKAGKPLFPLRPEDVPIGGEVWTDLEVAFAYLGGYRSALQ